MMRNLVHSALFRALKGQGAMQLTNLTSSEVRGPLSCSGYHDSLGRTGARLWYASLFLPHRSPLLDKPPPLLHFKRGILLVWGPWHKVFLPMSATCGANAFVLEKYEIGITSRNSCQPLTSSFKELRMGCGWNRTFPGTPPGQYLVKFAIVRYF